MTKRLYIRHVKGKGRGVFCNADIAAGETIEMAPVLVLPLEDNAAAKASVLGQYVFTVDKEAGTVAVVLGLGSIYNHANNSNADYEFDEETLLMHFFAVKDIKAGTEICTNYGGESGREYSEWFRSRGLQFVK